MVESRWTSWRSNVASAVTKAGQNYFIVLGVVVLAMLTSIAITTGIETVERAAGTDTEPARFEQTISERRRSRNTSNSLYFVAGRFDDGTGFDFRVDLTPDFWALTEGDAVEVRSSSLTGRVVGIAATRDDGRRVVLDRHRAVGSLWAQLLVVAALIGLVAALAKGMRPAEPATRATFVRIEVGVITVVVFLTALDGLVLRP